MGQLVTVACDRYDAPRISEAVRNACEALGVALPTQGQGFLHPACPWVHPAFAPASFTHLAVIEGVAGALRGMSLTIGTNSLPLFPTRYSYRKARYPALARQLEARLVCLEEEDYRVAELPSAGREGRTFRLPRLLAAADFSVSLPKLTGSSYVCFAGAIRHRYSLLAQADQLAEQHHLPERLVDLISLAPFNLIVVDAIQATHMGGEVSGLPVDLGVLIIGTDPLSVDLVCTGLYGLPPAHVDYLRLATERGLVPRDIDQVEVLGDLGLEELRLRSRRHTWHRMTGSLRR
ncbi:MAG: DUF362 domain-containing protein [Chloroflexota bacterium]